MYWVVRRRVDQTDWVELPDHQTRIVWYETRKKRDFGIRNFGWFGIPVCIPEIPNPNFTPRASSVTRNVSGKPTTRTKCHSIVFRLIPELSKELELSRIPNFLLSFHGFNHNEATADRWIRRSHTKLLTGRNSNHTYGAICEFYRMLARLRSRCRPALLTRLLPQLRGAKLARFAPRCCRGEARGEEARGADEQIRYCTVLSAI